MKKRLIYEDRAGNQLFRKAIKTRGAIQFSAMNAQGRLVEANGVHTLIRRAKKAGKMY